MLNLSQDQLAEITKSMREEHGANAEEVASILKRDRLFNFTEI